MATEPPETDAAAALEDRAEQLAYLSDASGTLAWDQRVMMPEGGAPARGKQLSALSTVTHDLLTDDEVGGWLDDLAAREDLEDDEQVLYRELRRQYDRADRVPADLVGELTETQSDAQQVWENAKADSDFDSFAPVLDDLRELHLERATHIDDTADPYEVMFEDGEPYLPLKRVEEIFDTLREHLVPLIEDLKASDAEFTSPYSGEYDDDTQMALCRTVVDHLGYDWDRGPLYTAPHPFMVGPQFDARITTRFAPEDPLGAVMSKIGRASCRERV